MGARARRPGGTKIEGTIGAKSVHSSPRGVRLSDGGSVQGVTLKVGRDFIPMTANECSASMVNVAGNNGVNGTVRKATRESLATERADTADLKTKAYDVTDRVATGVFSETTPNFVCGVSVGPVTRFVRTEEMGDEALPVTRLRVLAEQHAEREANAARAKAGKRKGSSNQSSTGKARQGNAEHERADKYVRSLGFAGKITPFIRQRALDALAMADSMVA
jgi:hypothetical protein